MKSEEEDTCEEDTCEEEDTYIHMQQASTIRIIPASIHYTHTSEEDDTWEEEDTYIHLRRRTLRRRTHTYI
jgi:hypothetical protein